ncbi:MAG: hypothetical protein QNK04_01655 [Myxococcota bacterium]|nr:hypothetical protein [Myxococcota bacterium]
MKLKEPPRIEDESLAVQGATREDVQERLRRFATLRAAQRALALSSRVYATEADLAALRAIREQLRDLVQRFEQAEGRGDLDPREALAGSQDELATIDGALEGYSRLLLAKLESIPLPQLRASLVGESDAQRAEMAALLELCMQSERTPSRFLAVVDLLVTLLAATKRDGVWFVETDPANLNEAVRERCWEAGSCEPGVEAMIVKRFQHAAEHLSIADEDSAILGEMSAYKNEIAGFFFVPSVLRCIVGYNVVARNHFEKRVRLFREADSAIDEEIGRLEDAAPPRQPSAEQAPLLPPDESPGVMAVQEAIQRRVAGAEPAAGPAARVADQLDLGWLGEPERQAFSAASDDPLARAVRLTVVLGHLAMAFPESESECADLGLHESQLDAWICALGDDVQSQMNELIRSDYAGALRLGDTKSRFLQAVLLLARRRHDPARQRWSGSEEPDTFRRDALTFIREYLERERFRQQKLFLDLMGGGWRRTVALSVMAILVAWVGVLHVMPAGPRGVDNFSAREARDVSPFLKDAYRDHAERGSMFVAVLAESWDDLDREKRRVAAEKIRQRMAAEGVQEILLYDESRVLVAHFKQGDWRNTRAWSP